MRIVDSTRYGDYFSCPRKRYLGHEYGGRGLSSMKESPDLSFGLGIHSGSEKLSLGFSLDEALDSLRCRVDKIEGLTPDNLPVKEEWYALGYGLLRGYKDFILPKLLEKYEFMGIEKELSFPLTPSLLWATRPDVIVRRKDDNVPFNINYKTSSYLHDLETTYEYSVQLMMEAEAISKFLGEWVGGSILIGFDKGSNRSVTNKEKEDTGKVGQRRISPFTYIYYSSGENTYQLEYTKKKGWGRVPVWTSIGSEKWYEILYKNNPKVIEEQFFSSIPLQSDPFLVERIKRQVVNVEDHIGVSLTTLKGPFTEDSVLDAYFPQNLSNCNNDGGYGKACLFKDFCHDEVVSSDPLRFYKWREFNHPIEGELVNG